MVKSALHPSMAVLVAPASCEPGFGPTLSWAILRLHPRSWPRWYSLGVWGRHCSPSAQPRFANEVEVRAEGQAASIVVAPRVRRKASIVLLHNIRLATRLTRYHHIGPDTGRSGPSQHAGSGRRQQACVWFPLARNLPRRASPRVRSWRLSPDALSRCSRKCASKVGAVLVEMAHGY